MAHPVYHAFINAERRRSLLKGAERKSCGTLRREKHKEDLAALAKTSGGAGCKILAFEKDRAAEGPAMYSIFPLKL